MILWLVQAIIVIGGGAFLFPQITSNALRGVLAILLIFALAVVLWGLVGAVRTRVIITAGTVLVRRAFTSDGFLLSEVRDVRQAASTHWLIVLEDDTSVPVPMDITNHARIGAALLEAAGENRARD